MATTNKSKNECSDFKEANEYQEISLIHQGRGSIVCLAFKKDSQSNRKSLPKTKSTSEQKSMYVLKRTFLSGKFSDLIPASRNLSEEIRRRRLYCEREIEALNLLKGHPNVSNDSLPVIELIDTNKADFAVELIFPYCRANLYDLIHHEEWFSFDVLIETKKEHKFKRVRQCSQMILEGLGHCHSNSIIHRDIKPSNILLDERGVIKLSDFGQARTANRNPNTEATGQDEKEEKTPPPMTAQVGSRHYRAPELLYGSNNYDFSIDMWSFGCLLAEICTKTVLFPGGSDIEQLMLIVEAIGEVPSANFNGSFLEDFNKISIESTRSREESLENFRLNVLMPLIAHNDCIDLILNLCTYKNRFNYQQALDHNFFLLADTQSGS